MTAPLRVLVVDHVAGVDAFRRKYEILAADPGVELTVLAPESWIENGREVRAPASVSGYRLRTGRVAWRGREARAFFLTGVASAIRGARPDVLHLQEEPFGLIALQCALLCRLIHPRTKIVFYTFDNLHEGFRYVYRPSWAYGIVQRIVHRLVDAGSTGCTDSGRVLLSRGFDKPLRYVPLAVDPERYRPLGPERKALRSERGLRGFVIGFVGRLHPIKGPDVLVEAVADLPGDWTLLVVGSGPERANLEAAARARGIGDRVRFVDGVAHHEIPRLLGLLDVLVLPSRTTRRSKEQFGRVLIEAMACDVPVVGSDCGSIPEVIGDAGRVFPEGDAGTLRRILAELGASENERARLAEAGRRRVRDHFTWQRVVAGWRDLWDGLRAGNLRSEPAPGWVRSDREGG